MFDILLKILFEFIHVLFKFDVILVHGFDEVVMKDSIGALSQLANSTF